MGADARRRRAAHGGLPGRARVPRRRRRARATSRARCARAAPRSSSATCRSAPSRRSRTTPRRASTPASRSSTACPVFIVSDPTWARRFARRGLPDRRRRHQGQVGATITHRTLARLFADRGVQLDRTYQLNTGGNTDFLNMLDRSRAELEEASPRPRRCRRSSTCALADDEHPHRPDRLRRRGRTTTRSASSAWRGAASATCR